jgi:hypothetical protein
MKKWFLSQTSKEHETFLVINQESFPLMCFWLVDLTGWLARQEILKGYWAVADIFLQAV